MFFYPLDSMMTSWIILATYCILFFTILPYKKLILYTHIYIFIKTQLKLAYNTSCQFCVGVTYLKSLLSVCWLVGWLVCRLVGWLVSRLVGWLPKQESYTSMLPSEDLFVYEWCRKLPRWLMMLATSLEYVHKCQLVSLSVRLSVFTCVR